MDEKDDPASKTEGLADPEAGNTAILLRILVLKMAIVKKAQIPMIDKIIGLALYVDDVEVEEVEEVPVLDENFVEL